MKLSICYNYSTYTLFVWGYTLSPVRIIAFFSGFVYELSHLTDFLEELAVFGRIYGKGDAHDTWVYSIRVLYELVLLLHFFCVSQ